MKKTISVFLAALLLLTLLPFSASAASIVKSGYCGGEGDGKNVSWTLDSDGCMTISGTGRMKACWIEDDTLSHIFNVSLWDKEIKDRITSVIIEDGVTFVGQAFCGCANLTTVKIGKSVSEFELEAFGLGLIEYNAFQYCPALKSIQVDPGNQRFDSTGNCLVDEEGKALISGCMNSVIPEDGSVKVILAKAFAGCWELTEIAIPGTVTQINHSAFADCSNLALVMIPKSVNRIDMFAFDNCSNLKTVAYGGNESSWDSLVYRYTNQYSRELDRATVYYNHSAHKDTDTKISRAPEGKDMGVITYTCSVCGKRTKALKSVEFNTAKAKTEYNHHDPLDLSGVKLMVTDVNGKTTTFDVTADMVQSGNTDTVGAQTVTLACGSVTASYQIQVYPIEVSALSLNQTEITLDEGQKNKLIVTLTPANATDDTVSWASDDNAVAKVSADGTVTAVSKGTAAITATAHNGKNAVCMVTVLRPTKTIKLNREALTLYLEESTALKLTLSPADTTDAVSWSSSNTGVVRVDDAGNITALNKGFAVITVTTERGLKATCLVTVKVHAEAVVLDQTALTLRVGDTRLLNAALEPAMSDDTVTWTSANPEIAAVSAAGRVTAKATGTVKITAKAESGKKAICTVTVVQPATNITLGKTTLTLNVGQTQTVSATFLPADSTDKVTWISSDPTVAAVSASGKVTAKGPGSAVITVTAESGKSAICKVTVMQPATNVSLSKTSLTLNVGQAQTLTAKLTPANSTDKVTWTSSATAIAAVDANGKITAKAPGSAVITVATTSGKTAACEVTVLVPATSIVLNTEEAILDLQEKLQLTATLEPKNTTDTVIWSSGKPEVAAVSPEGEVTALKVGTAKITAKTTSGLKAVCVVKVIKRALDISLDQSEARITILGDSVTLTGTVLPADATCQKLIWSSSNEKVAEVSAKGKVTALAEGEAVISATNAEGLLTAECKLTVISAPAGDVDGSGDITAADARLCLRRAVGLENYDENSREYIACNVDGDNDVTAADARLILRAAVGLEQLKSVSHYHVYGEETRTEPTCDKSGSIEKTCRICGEVNTKEIKPLGHQFEKVDGAKEPVCVRCGKTQCAVNGHTWGAASCTDPAVCTVCGKSSDKALGHDWQAATCTAPKTCTRCGATEGQALGHSWIAATCTEPKTCTVCGITEGKMAGHSWIAATCTSPKTCAVCGQIEGNALGHNWNAATCTSPKTCARCGQIEGKALGHTWKAATCTEPKSCIRCGITEGNALGHTYKNGVCVRCGVGPRVVIQFDCKDSCSYYRGNSIYSTCTIDSVQQEDEYYSYKNTITTTITVTGTCLYHEKGASYSDSMKVGWKLYDSDDFVVDSGTMYSSNVSMGERFKKEIIIFDLKPGKVYTLVFSSVD